jgi:superfamily II DNA or RNA helicase
MSLNKGFYESVINKLIDDQIKSIQTNEQVYIHKKDIDNAESSAVLSKYMYTVLNNSLNRISGEEKLHKQVEVCNKIINLLINELELDDFDEFIINENAELLLAVLNSLDVLAYKNKDDKIRPITSIATNSLFTGAKNEPSLGSELVKEIHTADKIDMLVSFIKWSGLVQIYEALKEFTQNHKLRIITTSYMGASDYKAILELSKLPNTEIKISYDTKRTRLHSKSYMFYRNTGFSTAYIGSSNLSNSALTTGLEWNLKISEYTSKEMINKFSATFESYWHDNEFYFFDNKNENDKKKLQIALSQNSGGNASCDSQFYFDIIPYSYQQEILDKLQAEREVHNTYKNLIVAATGTGKTIISAFDYKRFVKDNPGSKNRLLFVAHREEILKQSLDAFRGVLRDRNFGDLWVGKYEPTQIDHLFISIQTFNSQDFIENIKEDFYDYVVIDEFHHSAAPSYRKLLEYIKPKILLGMTATPERMDGKDITEYFDNKIAAEIRLGEAINRKILSPFNYFAVTDEVSLKEIEWKKGGYNVNELEKVYTKNNQRANLIIDSVKRYTKSITDIRAIGFCVSKLHAEFMSKYFNQVGIPSIFLTADSRDDERESAKRKLTDREVNFIFVVDLYNEGVDIPSVDTVLFLRPTESITVFLQQLGRGLRLCEGKDCLTVLDFVGQANKNYNFYEQKFRALIGNSSNPIEKEIENEFPNLPKGCFIQLEKVAKEYILESIRNVINNKINIKRKIIDYARDRSTYDVIEFCKNYNVELTDIYKNYSFTQLLSEAGIIKDFDYKKYKKESDGLSRLLHINSMEFIKFVLSVLKTTNFNYDELDEQEKLMFNMFYYELWQDTLEKSGFKKIEDSITKLKECPTLLNEIISILENNLENIDFKEKEMDLDYPCPLKLHCRYSMAEVLAAFGEHKLDRKFSFREGVKYLEDKKTDIFFITLNKSEKDYSETTMYDDYAIDDEYFHWQSQSGTSDTSQTSQRYINHETLGSKVMLFVRERKKVNGLTEPYYCLGTAKFVSYTGSRPMSIVWKLDHKMPEFIKKKASSNVMVG